MVKRIFFFSFLLCISFLGFAQQKTIIGKVLEKNSKTPIEFVNIIAKKVQDGSALAGTTTKVNGGFVLTYTGEADRIEVSFIGFETRSINISNEKNKIDLGTIYLSEASNELAAIELQGERSKTEFKLDKRVFHVGKDIGSTGASALEVLNNVPSVTVNVEGQISLRGSQGVQILINGKPSVLASEEGSALGSITSDMIEKIEVVTNPSAKHEASGTSGIINVVLKKNEKKGLNGSVTLNTGIPNNHSIGLSLNHRSEKVNLFSQLGYGHRTFPRETTISNKSDQSSLNTDGESDKNETFFNAILGMDYHINSSTVVTLSGHYAFEDELENALYRYTQKTNLETNIWERKEKTTATNPKWQYELQFKKDFEKKDHNLTFSALGSSFSKEKSSTFNNQRNAGSILLSDQKISTDFGENEYTFTIDYTLPIKETMKLEVGSHYRLNFVSNDYSVQQLINNQWQIDTNFSNIFDFNQKVLGAYTTFSYEKNKWGVKGGLRLENTDVDAELINTKEKNKQIYTNLFPSFHTSYKVSDALSFQAGYSRRIYRPSLWSLNPFTSFRNDFAVRTGNPNLKPEFSNSYEVTSIIHHNDGSLNVGVFQRNTDQVIDNIVEVNGNRTISKPENIGTRLTRGAEINWKYTPKEWLSINTDFNWSWFNRKGQLNNTEIDFSAQQWSTRITGQISLPKQFKVEITGNYRSKYKSIQGEVGDNIFMNLGIRKKLLKGRLNTNLSIRDVFASRISQVNINQGSFTQFSESQRGRFIVLGVSYGFGKGDAMEFSGHKRF
jgi:outer membrane receptor protein involved in Fe transport